MAKPTYEWFIEPLDDFTNDSIRKEIREKFDYSCGEEISAENATRELFDNKNKPHNVWQCSYEQVKYFWDSRDCGLNFRVFNRPITSQSKGKIKDVTFIFRHPHLQKRNPKTQKIRQQLKSIS